MAGGGGMKPKPLSWTHDGKVPEYYPGVFPAGEGVTNVTPLWSGPVLYAGQRFTGYKVELWDKYDDAGEYVSGGWWVPTYKETPVDGAMHQGFAGFEYAKLACEKAYRPEK